MCTTGYDERDLCVWVCTPRITVSKGRGEDGRGDDICQCGEVHWESGEGVQVLTWNGTAQWKSTILPLQPWHTWIVPHDGVGPKETKILLQLILSKKGFRTFCGFDLVIFGKWHHRDPSNTGKILALRWGPRVFCLNSKEICGWHSLGYFLYIC